MILKNHMQLFNLYLLFILFQRGKFKKHVQILSYVNNEVNHCSPICSWQTRLKYALVGKDI